MKSGKFVSITESKALEELSNLMRQEETSEDMDGESICYNDHLGYIFRVLKNVLTIVLGILSGTSLVYMLLIIVNMGNILQMRNIILRIDQFLFILVIVCFILSIQKRTVYQKKYLSILNTLEERRISSSKRRLCKLTVMSTIFFVTALISLINHRFVISLSERSAESIYDASKTDSLTFYMILQAILTVLLVVNWIMAVCSKAKFKTTDLNKN